MASAPEHRTWQVEEFPTEWTLYKENKENAQYVERPIQEPDDHRLEGQLPALSTEEIRRPGVKRHFDSLENSRAQHRSANWNYSRPNRAHSGLDSRGLRYADTKSGSRH
jgi:hypothetical protein